MNMDVRTMGMLDETSVQDIRALVLREKHLFLDKLHISKLLLHIASSLKRFEQSGAEDPERPAMGSQYIPS